MADRFVHRAAPSVGAAGKEGVGGVGGDGVHTYLRAEAASLPQRPATGDGGGAAPTPSAHATRGRGGGRGKRRWWRPSPAAPTLPWWWMSTRARGWRRSDGVVVRRRFTYVHAPPSRGSARGGERVRMSSPPSTEQHRGEATVRDLHARRWRGGGEVVAVEKWERGWSGAKIFKKKKRRPHCPHSSGAPHTRVRTNTLNLVARGFQKQKKRFQKRSVDFPRLQSFGARSQSSRFIVLHVRQKVYSFTGRQWRTVLR